MSISQEKKPANVILIGMMGSGKTTVGRLLAQSLGLGFIDTDSMVESKAGASIADIFEKRGEAGFREIELQILRKVSRAKGHVIAVGGGAVEAGDVWELLARNGVVVWLNPSLDEIARRLLVLVNTRSEEKIRPLLKDLLSFSGAEMQSNGRPHIDTKQDRQRRLKERLGALLGSRISVYRNCDVSVEPSFEAPETTVRAIIHELVAAGFTNFPRQKK